MSTITDSVTVSPDTKANRLRTVADWVATLEAPPEPIDFRLQVDARRITIWPADLVNARAVIDRLDEPKVDYRSSDSFTVEGQSPAGRVELWITKAWLRDEPADAPDEVDLFAATLTKVEVPA